MDNQSKLAEKLSAVLPHLNERQQRLLLAAEARSLGYGGVTQVSRASGVLRPTIYRDLRELLVESEEVQMVRLPGGGRKRIEEVDPTILDHLNQLIDPDTRGDPMSPLRWTCKSTRQLAAALQQRGHRISHQL